MDATPLTHLLSAASCPRIWENKTRKIKCNSRAVSLPPQGKGSGRSDWLWVIPLAPLILDDKEKLLLPGKAPEVHESVLWVFKIFLANPARDYSTGSYSMPFQTVVWCFSALTNELWLKSYCWGLLLSKGMWQLCAPGCWIAFSGYICLLSNLLMTYRILLHMLMDSLSDVWWLHHLLKKTWCPSRFGLNLLRWDSISRRSEKCCFLMGLSFEQDWRTWV